MDPGQEPLLLSHLPAVGLGAVGSGGSGTIPKRAVGACCPVGVSRMGNGCVDLAVRHPAATLALSPFVGGAGCVLSCGVSAPGAVRPCAWSAGVKEGASCPEALEPPPSLAPPVGVGAGIPLPFLAPEPRRGSFCPYPLLRALCRLAGADPGIPGAKHALLSLPTCKARWW